MSPVDQDELIKLRNEGGVVVAAIVHGTFREEKRILAALERLGGIIDSRQSVKVVLDMTTVEYLSSAGLGRLVALLKKTLSGGGCLHIAALRPEILVTDILMDKFIERRAGREMGPDPFLNLGLAHRGKSPPPCADLGKGGALAPGAQAAVVGLVDPHLFGINLPLYLKTAFRE